METGSPCVPPWPKNLRKRRPKARIQEGAPVGRHGAQPFCPILLGSIWLHLTSHEASHQERPGRRQNEAKMGQKKAPEPLRKTCKKRLPESTSFGSQNRPQNGSKSTPKLDQFLYKFLVQFWGCFWADFGCHLGPKTGPGEV